MALPLASAWWIAPAITSLLLALPVVVIWRLERRRPPSTPAEEPEVTVEVRFDSPGRLPPIGRVSWDEFDRRFAEYVEQSSRPDDPDRSAH